MKKSKYVTSDFFVWLTIVFVWLSATIDYFKNNYLEYFFHKNHKFSIQKEI